MISSSSFEQFQDAVFEALGAAPDDIDPGRLHRFSTNGKRRDTSGWCRLFEDGRAGVYGDFRTGLTGVWTAASAHALNAAERREIARQVARARAERLLQQRQSWAENAERNARTWGQCRPVVQGDPVMLYLQRRGFGAMWPLPQCLRFHPALRYRHADDSFTSHPAMVAPLPEARDIVMSVFAAVRGIRLGRVMINRIAPGGVIYPHPDTPEHCKYYSRFHVVLQSAEGVKFRAGDEWAAWETGAVFWFNNALEHEVINESPMDRIHMVLDARCSQ